MRKGTTGGPSIGKAPTKPTRSEIPDLRIARKWLGGAGHGSCLYKPSDMDNCVFFRVWLKVGSTKPALRGSGTLAGPPLRPERHRPGWGTTPLCCPAAWGARRCPKQGTRTLATCPLTNQCLFFPSKQQSHGSMNSDLGALWWRD